MKSRIIVISAAATGGIMFTCLNVPAGALVGSLLGTTLSQLFTAEQIYLPSRVKKTVRACMGTFIGLGISAEGVSRIKTVFWPAFINIFGMLLLTCFSAYIMHKLFKWDWTKAFLSSMPAGLTEISMNAEELGVDPTTVTCMHFFRLVSILILVPVIIKYLI